MIETSSKNQVLRSTAIFGSAQVFIMLMGIIRTKVLAVLLGPVGVGIAGLYQVTIDLIKTATGFGLGYSGVRDIAAAAATGDSNRVATVVLVLKRWSWAVGILGMLLTIVFSRAISQATFGNATYATGIQLVSVTLLVSALATARSALLQGFRQISSMAKATVWSALGGLIGASVIYYLWGIKGIIPAIILIAALDLAVTLFYSKKIGTVPVSVSLLQTLTEGKAMIRLGFFMTVSLLASTVSMYVVRAFIMQQSGVPAVGYFVASWTISSLYLSAIFNAMSADYFPRLSAVHHDTRAMNKIANDQTEIALLLTVPVIIGAIGFIDWLVPVFYSTKFSVTAQILSWQLSGDFFKVLSWPLGFMLLAKGKGLGFLFTELLWNILFCVIVYFGWIGFGIEITGISFLVAYILYLLVVHLVVSRLTGFRWRGDVWKTIGFFLPLLCLTFTSYRFLDGTARFLLSGSLTIAALIYSYFQLRYLIDFKNVVRKLLGNKTAG